MTVYVWPFITETPVQKQQHVKSRMHICRGQSLPLCVCKLYYMHAHCHTLCTAWTLDALFLVSFMVASGDISVPFMHPCSCKKCACKIAN